MPAARRVWQSQTPRQFAKQTAPAAPVDFTGIVFACNEARYLPACLESLAFCEQLLVVDLGSSDGSPEIARRHGAEVIQRAWVPVVEQARAEVLPHARHDWLIFLDPDEVFPSGAVDLLRDLIEGDERLAAVALPWQFTFRGKPLHVTQWGMEKTKRIVAHRQRVRMDAAVFSGIQPLDGYAVTELPRQPATTIRHNWADSFRQLIRKHRRYLPLDGEARYHKGERFTWRRWASKSARALKQNLFDYRGLRGGLTGVLLSVFYAWFVSAGLLALRRTERRARQQAWEGSHEPI